MTNYIKKIHDEYFDIHLFNIYRSESPRKISNAIYNHYSEYLEKEKNLNKKYKLTKNIHKLDKLELFYFKLNTYHAKSKNKICQFLLYKLCSLIYAIYNRKLITIISEINCSKSFISTIYTLKCAYTHALIEKILKDVMLPD